MAALVFKWIAHAYGHHAHFWIKVIGAVIVGATGYMVDRMSDFMLAYTTFLTVMTDLGTIVIQNSGEGDTRDIKDEVKEIARAVPGAKVVTKD